MAKLMFKNPVFKDGENLSVRKGIKWDLAEKNNVPIVATDKPDEILLTVDIQTKVMRFCDLRDSDLTNEPDPDCRFYNGLLVAMKIVYLGFDERELVTLVTFEYF